jgi:two-component system, LytTR family, response regulator
MTEKLLVRANKAWVLLRAKEIQWLEAQGERTLLHCGEKQYSISAGIWFVERELDPHQFVRIHRSYMVNIDTIHELKPREHRGYDVILHDGTQLIWSRNYMDRFQTLQRLATTIPRKQNGN